MQNIQSYDTSTQAMTEVALALSMAFFALLIVALLSFKVPQKQVEETKNTEHKENSAEKIQVKKAQKQSSTSSGAEQVIFLHQGKFIDQDLKPFSLTSIQSKQALVLAVPATLAFSEVMAIRKKINHPNLSITLINKQWQTLLEQRL